MDVYRIIRFLISGGSAATVDIAVLWILEEKFDMWYLTASVLAFLVAFLVSFFLQKFWTFRDANKEGMHRQMVVYFTVSVINLCLNTLLMYVFVDWFGIWYILSQVIVSLMIACMSFFIYRRIFSRNETTHPYPES